MTQWEYTLNLLHKDDATKLNELGKQGWEAVAVYDYVAQTYVLLKRPISK